MAEGELEPLLDAKLLRLFLLLYQGGSVTRAAEQLGQSQPTISIWLGRLRRSLNDPLFVRTAEGMLPTPRAEALAGPARAALEALRQVSAPEPAFTPWTTRRQFRICMTDASHITLLPRILAKLRDAAPLAQLEVVRIGPDTGHRLQSGEVDLALGFVPELEAGFYQLALYEQDWVCLANREHPRLGAELTLREFAAEGHVGIVSGTGHALQEDALQRHRITRRMVLELPGFLGLGAILSTTDLIVTLPRHIGTTLAELNGLQLYPCPMAITGFTVKLHWHARFHQDAANKWLRGQCAGLFHGRSPN
ncbi:LysR family transcriptional regulator [Muricoccus aerilatus]|uniref:LysR family transcriptional regulator n=1 Tax=Muricoccus aerilatus TaxID=452982 RepID=UPI0005C1AD83|nr:LysR family transcriptional regulator [Roseomonas aerilata]